VLIHHPFCLSSAGPFDIIWEHFTEDIGSIWSDETERSFQALAAILIDAREVNKCALIGIAEHDRS